MSNEPNPSSIAIKFGRGKLDTLINAVLIAIDEMNFSIPLVSSNGQNSVSPYAIYELIFLPSVLSRISKSTIGCKMLLISISNFY